MSLQSLAAGRFLKKGSKLVRPKLKDARVEKVLDESGGEIEGFETTHVRLETSYGGKVQVLFMSWDYEVDEGQKEPMLVSNLREVTVSDVPPGHFESPECKPVEKKDMEKEVTRMLKKHIR